MCREVKRRTDRLTVLLNNSGATWYGLRFRDCGEANCRQGWGLCRLPGERLG
jgi:hypothetical protein